MTYTYDKLIAGSGRDRSGQHFFRPGDLFSAFGNTANNVLNICQINPSIDKKETISRCFWGAAPGSRTHDNNISNAL